MVRKTLNVIEWMEIVKDAISRNYKNFILDYSEKTEFEVELDSLHDDLVDLIFKFPFEEIEISVLDTLCIYNNQLWDMVAKTLQGA